MDNLDKTFYEHQDLGEGYHSAIAHFWNARSITIASAVPVTLEESGGVGRQENLDV